MVNIAVTDRINRALIKAVTFTSFRSWIALDVECPIDEHIELALVLTIHKSCRFCLYSSKAYLPDYLMNTNIDLSPHTGYFHKDDVS